MQSAGSGKQEAASIHALLAQSQTITGIKGLFAAFVRPFGFNAFAAGEPPASTVVGVSVPPPPFLMLEWPQAWLELYAREGFAQDDVVVEEAANTDTPFTWADIQARRPGASCRIFAAAAQFGWLDGFVIPVPTRTGTNHNRGVVSLASLKALKLSEVDRASLIDLSRAAYERAWALRKLNDRSQGQNGWTLTAREREVLDLVGKGLNDAAIGRALGVTARTAHFHVENAKKRLGAANRAQAVAIYSKRSAPIEP